MLLLPVGRRRQEVCRRQELQLVASGTLGQTRGTRCQSRCLPASDCRPWTQACNCSKGLCARARRPFHRAMRLGGVAGGRSSFALKAVPTMRRPSLRPRCGAFVSERLAAIIRDTFENASNLSELIEQNTNIFAYSSFVKL